MSKIIKALEKAEEAERLAAASPAGIIVPDAVPARPVAQAAQVAQAAPAAPAAPVAQAAPAQRVVPQVAGAERRDSVEVRYEQTRVEQACFHKMEERRLLGEGAPRELRDAFNVVRTRILQQTRPGGLNTIMVTSPGRGTGTQAGAPAAGGRTTARCTAGRTRSTPGHHRPPRRPGPIHGMPASAPAAAAGAGHHGPGHV